MKAYCTDIREVVMGERADAYRRYLDAAVKTQHTAAELMDLVEGTDEYTQVQARLDQECAACRDAHADYRRVCG